MDVRLMPKPSNRYKQRRPILAGRHIFRFGLNIMKANYFFFVLGLTCMDKLFTTEIAKCANEINSQF